MAAHVQLTVVKPTKQMVDLVPAPAAACMAKQQTQKPHYHFQHTAIYNHAVRSRANSCIVRANKYPHKLTKPILMAKNNVVSILDCSLEATIFGYSKFVSERGV